MRVLFYTATAVVCMFAGVTQAVRYVSHSPTLTPPSICYSLNAVESYDQIDSFAQLDAFAVDSTTVQQMQAKAEAKKASDAVAETEAEATAAAEKEAEKRK